MNHDRQTDTHEGGLVVFLLGMRPHRTWRIDQTVFATRAMFAMRAELRRDRARGGALGYLGGYVALTATGPMVVQYWRDFDSLERYAHASDRRHRPAWLDFYAKTHRSGAARVGLWHETFRVPAGAYETIYSDVPGPQGLGAAVGMQPLARRGETSRERLGA